MTGDVEAAKPTHPLLIVDDDAVARQVAKANLEPRGWDILLANDGRAGLEKIREHAKSGIVVLTDVDMPKLKGPQMLNEAEGSLFEAVILSGFDQFDNVRGSFQAGAAEFVVKPVNDWDALNEALQRGDRRLRRRNEQSAYHAKLEQQADWMYWKAMFLGGGDQSELHNVLDALHIQFNQDANYVHLISQLKKQEPDDAGNVTMPIELVDIMLGSITPIARMAEGIGIAQSVMNSSPKLRNISAKSIPGWIEVLESDVLKPLAEVRGHNLQVWVDEGLLTNAHYLYGDKEILSTVLTELCVNAFKYSKPGDEVSLNVQSTSDDTLDIMIMNPARPTTRLQSGDIVMGIPRELGTMVFRFFIRYSIETQTGYDEAWPMGLGLPLAREVIEQHNGKISIKNERWHLTQGNEDPDVLVTCRIELPLNQHPLAEDIVVTGKSTMQIMKKLRDGVAVDEAPVDGAANSEDVDLDGIELF